MSEQAIFGGKREQTKAANRAAILAAAEGVFAEMGFGAASVRDIVRRTDLASGTFYNYFPDKEAVFRELIEQVALDARTVTAAARARATNLDEFVELGFRAYFEMIAEQPQRLALLRRNAGALRTMFDDPGIVGGIEEIRRDLVAAIERGLIPRVDPDYFAAAMVGVGVELAVQLAEREPPDVDGATRVASALFTGGIRSLGGA